MISENKTPAISLNKKEFARISEANFGVSFNFRTIIKFIPKLANAGIMALKARI
jgi:hypothetical protein